MDDVPQTGDLASYLGELRKAAGLTQEGLAAITEGVSESLIGNIESRRRNGSVRSIDALADALKCTDAERARLHELREAMKRGVSAEELVRRLGDLEERVGAIEDQMAPKGNVRTIGSGRYVKRNDEGRTLEGDEMAATKTTGRKKKVRISEDPRPTGVPEGQDE